MEVKVKGMPYWLIDMNQNILPVTLLLSATHNGWPDTSLVEDTFSFTTVCDQA
jgi:hypothetical protein